MSSLSVHIVGVTNIGDNRMNSFKIKWIVRGLIIINISAIIGIAGYIMEAYL